MKKHIRNLIILTPLFFCGLVLFFFGFPQEVLPGGGSGNIAFAVDFLTFRSVEPEKTLLEVFCQVSTRNLIFVKFRDGFFASSKLTLEMYDYSGQRLFYQSVIDSVKVKTFKEIDRPRPDRLIQFTSPVNPGEYVLRIFMEDLETRKALTFEKKIRVPDYRQPGLQISDIQIAAAMSNTKKGGPLVKNGVEIVPNVLRILRAQENVLYVYSEIYNLRSNTESASTEVVATFVIKGEKNEAILSIERILRKPGSTCNLSAQIPLGKFKAGEYQLTLEVEEPDSRQKIKKSTTFYLVKAQSSSNDEVGVELFEHPSVTGVPKSSATPSFMIL